MKNSTTIIKVVSSASVAFVNPFFVVVFRLVFTIAIYFPEDFPLIVSGLGEENSNGKMSNIKRKSSSLLLFV
jgi:hypothetical protein